MEEGQAPPTVREKTTRAREFSSYCAAAAVHPTVLPYQPASWGFILAPQGGRADQTMQSRTQKEEPLLHAPGAVVPWAGMRAAPWRERGSIVI